MQFFHVHVEITVFNICHFLLFGYKNICGCITCFFNVTQYCKCFFLKTCILRGTCILWARPCNEIFLFRRKLMFCFQDIQVLTQVFNIQLSMSIRTRQGAFLNISVELKLIGLSQKTWLIDRYISQCNNFHKSFKQFGGLFLSCRSFSI